MSQYESDWSRAVGVSFGAKDLRTFGGVDQDSRVAVKIAEGVVSGRNIKRGLEAVCWGRRW
jgi:hypothetical protein